jgi:hypothetical protein
MILEQGTLTAVTAIALALAILAVAGLVVLAARQQRLIRQYRQLIGGTSGGNLEQVLQEHMVEVRRAVARVEEIGQLTQSLEASAAWSIQHVGLLRFNPFQNAGGDQSFALALADAKGDGVVLSSLHARELTRMYAKSLQGWQSAHLLTAEEQQAIDLARTRTG